MPAAPSGRVLVTGANGYIAVWIVKKLLDAGFAVRGTVRSASKAMHLRNLFKAAGEKIELVIVDDIVEDVTAIIHNATPVHLNAAEPDEMIIPTLQGTLGILESARAHGTALQRVVVLSSTATVWRSNTDPSKALDLDETCWNDEEVAQCREQGRAETPLAMYRANKTLAERAAWEFIGKYSGEGGVGWDLVKLSPFVCRRAMSA